MKIKTFLTKLALSTSLLSIPLGIGAINVCLSNKLNTSDLKNDENTNIYNCGLNDDFTKQHNYNYGIDSDKFKNQFPSNNTLKMIEIIKKYGPSKFIMENIDLFVSGKHNITEEKIVVSELIDNFSNGKNAIRISFYFKPGSLIRNGKTNTENAPMRKFFDKEGYYTSSISYNIYIPDAILDSNYTPVTYDDFNTFSLTKIDKVTYFFSSKSNQMVVAGASSLILIVLIIIVLTIVLISKRKNKNNLVYMVEKNNKKK